LLQSSSDCSSSRFIICCVSCCSRVLGNGIPFGLDALEGLSCSWKIEDGKASGFCLICLIMSVALRIGKSGNGRWQFRTLSDSIRQLPAPPPAGCPGTAPLSGRIQSTGRTHHAASEPMHSLAVLALASLVPVSTAGEIPPVKLGKAKILLSPILTII